MAIINPLTYNIANGQAVDAVPLMADLNQIVNNVNANAAALAGSSSQVFNVANAATSTEAVALGQVLPILGRNGQVIYTASTTLTAANAGQIVTYAGTAAATFTLPAANAATVGLMPVIINNNSGYTLTVAPTTGDSIGNSTVTVIQQGQQAAFWNDGGTTWIELWNMAGTNSPFVVGNATAPNQAIARGQVLNVAPVINGLGVSTPAASTTYSVSGSFTAPCNGYVIAWGSLAIGASLASGAAITIKTYINGVGGSSDQSPWPLTTEYQSQSVAAGSAVSFNFDAATNTTAPGTVIVLHVLAIFVPNP